VIAYFLEIDITGGGNAKNSGHGASTFCITVGDNGEQGDEQ